ncbi:MAG: tRNA (N6-isopentenyl adenosine(37)-C2)-methylthiotransferase MiaB [bacterium]
MALRYYLQVYGCQMNLYEAGLVRSILNQAGFQETENEFAADLLLMMTCSVRAHAEQRALGRLSQWVARKRDYPLLITGILGCMAQNLKDTLIKHYRADLVIGPDQYGRLPDLVNKFFTTDEPQLAVDFNEETYENVCPEIKNQVSAFVTIMRGCSNFCSYCIVPYVKGGERSKPLPAILSEIQRFVSQGIKEITLLGQNVLAYNDQGVDFCTLLEEVCAVPEIVRVRFLTSHPRDLNQKIIETIARLPKVCPQLHLPLQSGANRILELMNRGYTVDQYLARVEMVRRYLPDISLTTDVIVGFPTETEAEFEATLRVLQDVRFDYAYMFRFSPRPGTPAAGIKPLVPTQVAQRRLRQLIQLQNRITLESNRAMLGRDYQVLIEGHSPRGRGSLGRTPQGKVVILDELFAPGYLVNVRITEINGWTPKGKPITPGLRGECKRSTQPVNYCDGKGGR